MLDNIYTDASFFIALQITNHPFHQEATKILEEYSDSTFYFSLLTLDEIIYALSKYKFSKKQIAFVIKDKIIEIENIKLLTYKDDINEIKSYLKVWQDTGLKPRDALHLYLMKSGNIDNLATFDEDFTKHEKELKIKVVNYEN